MSIHTVKKPVIMFCKKPFWTWSLLNVDGFWLVVSVSIVYAAGEKSLWKWFKLLLFVTAIVVIVDVWNYLSSNNIRSKSHRACMEKGETGGLAPRPRLDEPAFQHRGQQPSQPAYLPDRHHGQDRIPTLPKPLTRESGDPQQSRKVSVHK